jgi:hypothetical protein
VIFLRQDLCLSQILDSVLTVKKDSHITIGELMSRIAERGFGMLLVLLALPTLIPVLPPGSAATIGLIYTIIGFQMLFGMKYPWMPQRVKNYRLSEKTALKLREKGVAFFRVLERFSCSRLLFFDTDIMLRFVALPVILMGLILLTPLPFMNTIPALSVMLIGIGLLNRDGIFILAGLLLSISMLGIIYLGLDTLLHSIFSYAPPISPN